jgi:predicted ester cyclase
MPTNTSQQEANKATVRRLVEEFMNQNNPAVVDEAWTPDYKLYPAGDSQPMDFQTHKQDFPDLRSIFPDLKATIVEQLAEGDLVATRQTLTGTHRGEMRTPFGTFQGTGKQATWSTIIIHSFQNGKIKEGHIIYNPVEILQQLGLVAEWPVGPGSAKPVGAPAQFELDQNTP